MKKTTNKVTIDLSNYVVSNDLPYINLDSPQLKDYIAKTNKVLTSSRFAEQLKKITQ